jgi:tetratricopeptide (TPR) repeat protein
MPIRRNTDGIFIGREDALHFFREHILTAGQPTHNILSIYGEAGVGKTTLLNRLKNMADSPEFNHSCVTALVDMVPSTPFSVGVMKQVADQLAAAGHRLAKFEKQFDDYEDDLQKVPVKQETVGTKAVEDAQKVVATAAGLVQVAGPAGQVVKDVATSGIDIAGAFIEKKMDEHYSQEEVKRLYDEIGDLTSAFVDDLDRIADNRLRLLPSFARHKRLVILFFDAFDRIADDVSPWLLDRFLRAIIDEKKTAASEYVVLVVASRKPIQRVSDRAELSNWQSYLQTIQPLSLSRFTYEETRLYLEQQGITDHAMIHSLYTDSHGLPFYLSLVKPDPQGNIDLTEDVVKIYLNSIPEQDADKRRLARVAALLSRPFNQDDLAAFPFLAQQDIPVLYEWLTEQSFVQRTQDGRYCYPELATELFRRDLYQTSEDGYYAIRRSLAAYYRKELEQLEQEQGEEIYRSTEWLELVRAFVYQAFFLTDMQSHIEAVRCIINAYVHVKHSEEIAGILRDLSKEHFYNASNPARQVIEHLLVTITADLNSQKFLDAHTYLLHIVENAPEALFPKALLAHIYDWRGRSYLSLHRYQQAITDFNQAITLDANDAWKYVDRGLAYRLSKNNQQALQDFDQAIKLQPDFLAAYAQRAFTNSELKHYEQAINDLNAAIEINPKYGWAYGQRGRAYRQLKNYQQALQDLSQAITLDPSDAWALSQKGLTYLWLKDADSASAAYTHSWKLNPKNLYSEWMSEWARMCLFKADVQTAVRLEKIVAEDANHLLAACRGVALWLRRDLEGAHAELEQAIAQHQDRWDLLFWYGLTCASLGRNEEAAIALEKALTLDLPPILLAPLRWLEQDKAEFYEQHAKPILARYG